MVLRILVLLLVSFAAHAGPLSDAIDHLELQLLAETYDNRKVDRLLEGYGHDLQDRERQSAAVLVSMGVLRPEDLRNRLLTQKKIEAFSALMVSDHHTRLGQVGETSLVLALDQDLDYEPLENDAFVEILASRLADGVITGYDIRRKGVYDGFQPGHTFIYSQSSRLHLQQLATLLASEDLAAWVYLTPKVAAFLYREEWGGGSSRLKKLPSGIKIIEGQEVATLFQFDSPEDRLRFHELVLRYAKKDTEDEAGLIANSWWQPFYYTDTPLEGFKPIALVILSYGELEATLTVPEGKADTVVAAFADSDVSRRVDRVWVNPAFYRFLHGGFK